MSASPKTSPKVIRDFRVEYDWEADVDPKTGKPVNVQVTGLRSTLPAGALNYDAPPYAICCDLRADGGLLPRLCDPVPARRPRHLRPHKGLEFKRGPDHGSLLSPPPIDSTPNPTHPDTAAPNRPHGVPWTSTGPGGPFSSYPHIPHRPISPSPAGLAPRFASGGGPTPGPIGPYPEHSAGEPARPAPPRSGALKAGKGPGLFDDSGRLGPAAVPRDPVRKPRRALPLPTPVRKPLGGTFGPAPEHMADPYDGNPLGKMRGSGMWTCWTSTGPIVPIINPWSAPNAQAASGVKLARPDRSGFVRTVGPVRAMSAGVTMPAAAASAPVGAMSR